MPYIIKNGKTYTGNSVSLTQAQYNALSDAEKNNGITYYIYDSDAVLDASDVGLGTGSVETLAGSVAVIETSPATASHAVGSYIVWNGQLYEVTSAISSGETLVVGTNVVATSTGAELSELKNGLTDKIIVKYFDKTTTTGAFFIEANELPAGVTVSSHWFIVQPMYGSTALLGYVIALQISGARLACYVRQGTTLPADGSRVVFNLFCIKM